MQPFILQTHTHTHTRIARSVRILRPERNKNKKFIRIITALKRSSRNENCPSMVVRANVCILNNSECKKLRERVCVYCIHFIYR